MKVTKTIDEFARVNDRDLRRFMMYVLKTSDHDMVEDCIQSFYYAAIKGNLIESFDPGNKPVGKAFEDYICASARNMAFTYMRNTMREKGRGKMSTVKDPATGENTDIFETIQISRNKSTRGYRTDPFCVYSNVDQDNEKSIVSTLREFRDQVSEDTTMSDTTRKLCTTYIQMASNGMTPFEISQAVDVQPAYISYIRGRLREKYKAARAAVTRQHTLMGLL